MADQPTYREGVLEEDRVTMRRLTVTHTRSLIYNPRAISQAWIDLRPIIPGYLLRGDEGTNEDSRAMTVYEALGHDTLLELFHDQQDDDVGYEVEDYDPEA